MEPLENPYESPRTRGVVAEALPPRGLLRTVAALLSALPGIFCVGVAMFFWSWHYAYRGQLEWLKLWQHGVLLGYFSVGLVWLAAAIAWYRRRDRWAWGLTVLGLSPIAAIAIKEML